MNSQGKTQTENHTNPLSHWAFYILPLWGFLVLILCQINFPPVTQALVGPDDYIRGVRILDLLNGIGHPFLVERMGIPPGGEVVWSRLVDMPLYILTTIMEPLTGDQRLAFYWAATILPLTQFIIMMVVLCWTVTPLTSAKRAVIALGVLLLMTKVTGEYRPGRIDHHGWQIILMLGGYGSLIRLYLDPALKRWPVIAGLCFATGFAVGADLVLWTGLAAILAGMLWLIKGSDYIRPNLMFGATITALTAIYYAIFQPPGGYLIPSCDVLSITYVSLAAAIIFFWGAVRVTPENFRDTLYKRAGLGAVIAAALLTGLFNLYPQCFTDIYNLQSPILYDVWISQDHESRSMFAHAEFYPALTLFFVATILLGLISAASAAFVEKENRALWLGFTFILALGFTACVFHLRLVTFAQLLAILPLSWAINAIWNKARTMTFGLRELGILGGIFFAFIVGVSMMNEKKAMEAAQAIEAAADMSEIENAALADRLTYCPIAEIAGALNEIEAQQTLATSYIFNGSEVLFRTHHRVLGAPYHRNAAGIEATYNLFAADAGEAEKLAQSYDVDLILLCPGYWPFPGEDIQAENTLVSRLLKEDPPSWLSRADDITGGGFHVYRVK